MSGRAFGELLAFGSLMMFSTNIILTKVASARLALDTGFLISVAVNVMTAALLVVGRLLAWPEPLLWNWIGFLLFMGAGAFATYLGRFFFFEAIARLGPARASTFQSSSPLFTVVIAWLFLGERLNPVSIAAMVVAMLGLVLSTVNPRTVFRGRATAAGAAGATESGRARLGRLVRSGFMLGAGSSAAYAMGNVLRGAAVRQWNEIVLGALLGALAALAVHLVLGGTRQARLSVLRNADRKGLAIYALGGVLTVLAQMLLIEAMRYTPVAIVALISISTPLLVFPMSYFLLRNAEGIGLRTLLGGTLTLIAIAVIVLH